MGVRRGDGLGMADAPRPRPFCVGQFGACAEEELWTSRLTVTVWQMFIPRSSLLGPVRRHRTRRGTEGIDREGWGKPKIDFLSTLPTYIRPSNSLHLLYQLNHKSAVLVRNPKHRARLLLAITNDRASSPILAFHFAHCSSSAQGERAHY